MGAEHQVLPGSGPASLATKAETLVRDKLY